MLGPVGHYKDFGIYSERNGEPSILRYGLICSALCINQDHFSCSGESRS